MQGDSPTHGLLAKQFNTLSAAVPINQGLAYRMGTFHGPRSELWEDRGLAGGSPIWPSC